MREIVHSSAFKRDVKKLKSQGKNFQALVTVFDALATAAQIPAVYRDHALKGKWARYRELHIEPDWLLIYRVEGDTVYLARTGSHAELLQR